MWAVLRDVMWRTLNSYGVPETTATSTPHLTTPRSNEPHV